MNLEPIDYLIQAGEKKDLFQSRASASVGPKGGPLEARGSGGPAAAGPTLLPQSQSPQRAASACFAAVPDRVVHTVYFS